MSRSSLQLCPRPCLPPFNGRWWIIQVQEMYVVQSILRMIAACQAGASDRRRWRPRGSQRTRLEIGAPRPSPLPWSPTRTRTRPGCSTRPCRSFTWDVSLTIFRIHLVIAHALVPSLPASMQCPPVDPGLGIACACASTHLADGCGMSSCF